MLTMTESVNEALSDALINFAFSPINDKTIAAMKDMAKSMLVARYPVHDDKKFKIDVSASGNRVSVSPGNKYTEKLFCKLTMG